MFTARAATNSTVVAEIADSASVLARRRIGLPAADRAAAVKLPEQQPERDHIRAQIVTRFSSSSPPLNL